MTRRPFSSADPSSQASSEEPTLLTKTMSLFRRDGDKCKGSSQCEMPNSTPTVAIVLAVVIPVIIVAVLIFVLHRRIVRKNRKEDLQDQEKALDYGIDGGDATKKKSDSRGTRGMSILPDVYLAPNVKSSRESLTSISRSFIDSSDPYSHVKIGKELGNRTVLSPDANSMQGSLLKDAQAVPNSAPVRTDTSSTFEMNSKPVAPANTLPPAAHVLDNFSRPMPASNPQLTVDHDHTTYSINDYYNNSGPEKSLLDKKHGSEGQDSLVPSVDMEKNPHETAYAAYNPGAVNPIPELRINRESNATVSDYGEDNVQSPRKAQPAAQAHPAAVQVSPPDNHRLTVRQSRLDGHRMSMGVRPLPYVDPTDTAEQRANRIRSFFKEYFDESEQQRQADGNETTYLGGPDDYNQEYGNIPNGLPPPQAPYIQPTARRAMTPPPRAPPRYNSRQGPIPHGRSSSSSFGRFQSPPPRGMSSMSGRMPREILPPPMPLSSLPTPSKLTEESLVFTPIDFAPPVTFRDRQAGRRPDSPLGGQRPYSPSVRPHVPLASAYDSLVPIPSPHALRKSGTFTALDFAPPPRIRGNDNWETSSVNSGHSVNSGISSSALYALRSGAHRISRLPQEVVGTKDTIAHSLRPTMDMRS